MWGDFVDQGAGVQRVMFSELTKTCDEGLEWEQTLKGPTKTEGKKKKKNGADICAVMRYIIVIIIIKSR